MPTDVIVRIRSARGIVDLPGTVDTIGPAASPTFEERRSTPGIRLLAVAVSDNDYAISLQLPVPAESLAALREREGKAVLIVFPGRTPVRRRLRALAASTAHVAPDPGVASQAAPLDLTAGREGAAPLWLLPAGVFSTTPTVSPEGVAARDALVTAARWISSRRTSTLAQLFPPSAFHPEEPVRKERLSAGRGMAMLEQARAALQVAAVGGEEARRDPTGAATLRSAALTVLSHLIATSLDDRGFAPVAELAAAEIFALVEREAGDEAARPALRAHAIHLLQLRAPGLTAAQQERARELVRGLLREAPPYDELTGPWNFAMCGASEFHEGECRILVLTHGFKEIPLPPDAPPSPGGWSPYRVFEAPFKTPAGAPIRVFARGASPRDENLEMGMRFFAGLLINRHAQLGAFDLRAAAVQVRQEGYKLMMNAQCAGLTTRFAISQMFPDADIYSSWDSTYFRVGPDGVVNASEGVDCFVAALRGMSERASHAELDARIREAQWHHAQAEAPGFSQFVGPSHPLVVARYSDVNRDGRADYYDGFLDFQLTEIAEDIEASMTPRDPGVSASQISGQAAAGLNWAAGSLNRVAQYSDIWAGLPGQSELYYVFQSGGFYSHREPPHDVPAGDAVEQDLGRLPAVTRYQRNKDAPGGLTVEVMFHSHLSHAAQELKRLLCAADAMRRAFDLGYLALEAGEALSTPRGQRCAMLLTMAGLLEFPADQNFIDGLWSMALKALRLPEVSRSTVRACITAEDHAMSNYYGSRRGLGQLLAWLERSDPSVFQQLGSEDPRVGRLAKIEVGAAGEDRRGDREGGRGSGG
ncbi:hypothetical protein SOCEGT47_085170 [Sorangium cellulosum]|uniref:Uncharacterized protein n=1 Tax=Sorangium cellulosum TaxID=56 RepID=A0A4P2QDP3_SORCE|nr:hypothetical protein [Sorangium cellulosum]AUX27917.1 hypothetical protein SOCEGT47_085170 [Sorangium cellulosum]